MKVFISYKHEKSITEWVQRFASDLKGAGLKVILDQWEVKLGESFSEYMTSRIQDANVVLFVITDHFMDAVEAGQESGGAVKFEMQMAMARRMAGEDLRIIGILREGERQPAQIRDNRYADFRDETRYAENVQNLVRDLRGSPTPLFQGGIAPARIFEPEVRQRPANLSPRLSLSQYLRDIKEYYGLSPNTGKSFRRGCHCDQLREGRWTSATGGMWLEHEEDDGVYREPFIQEFSGEYDWGKLRSVGVVQGTLQGNVTLFDWKWKTVDSNPADKGKRGNGFFLYDFEFTDVYGPRASISEVLVGGWFFSEQMVNLEHAMIGKVDPDVHPWIFYRSSEKRYIGSR